LRFILAFCFFIAVGYHTICYSQITDTELGRATTYSRSGLYDFSDPGSINIKVAVWGYIARPGKYVIPDYTTVSDLISFAGGPSQEAVMDDLRIYRIREDGTEEMIKFSYDDIMWEDNLTVKARQTPTLKASDILVIPGSPKLFFQDWFNIGIQVFSVVLTIVNLVILISLYK
jgi:hypothetical protein